MKNTFSRSSSLVKPRVKLRRPETKGLQQRPHTLANSKILWNGCGIRHGQNFPTNFLPKISELQVVLT